MREGQGEKGSSSDDDDDELISWISKERLELERQDQVEENDERGRRIQPWTQRLAPVR